MTTAWHEVQHEPITWEMFLDIDQDVGVYADPAGHPFCLIRRPGWAPPIPPEADRL
jgi:hypothetical protein